jgi:hypothetical protein
MKLGFIDEKPSQNHLNTAMLFGVKEELDKHRMCINVLRSNLVEINPDKGSATFKCPKIPKDTDARIGVRRDPQNANKKQKFLDTILSFQHPLNRISSLNCPWPQPISQAMVKKVKKY